jgi:catechol 2,3-dioxygenase-like lactoylglutathione lyase family enzyme
VSRVQLALNVSDVDAAVEFYSKLFGAEPAKRRPGYANFAIAEPPLKLVLIENTAGRGAGVAGALNHLGVEVETPEDVRDATRRLAGEGLGPQVQESTTGLRDHEALAAGFDPLTVAAAADDHKAYYPGSHRIEMRVTGDRRSGRLLGLQLFGHRHAEIAKRVDIAATAIFHEMTVDGLSDLDLSYTPPLGSPWEALQTGAQAWVMAWNR